MKGKKIIVSCILAFMLISPNLTYNVKALGNIALDDSARLNDMVITLLMPSVRYAVGSFYAPYLTTMPVVAGYYGTTIVDIQGGEQIREGIYHSDYTVTIDVTPYVGPHISVGKDRITLNFKSSEIAVTNYESGKPSASSALSVDHQEAVALKHFSK